MSPGAPTDRVTLARLALIDALDGDPEAQAVEICLLPIDASVQCTGTLVAAARSAAARGAHAESARWWVEAARRTPDRDEQRRLFEGAAAATFLAGRPDQLAAVLDELLAEALPEQAARWIALRLLADLDHADPLGRMGEIDAIAVRVAASDTEAADALRITAAFALVLAGHCEQAVRVADELRATGRELPLAARLIADGIDVVVGRTGAGELIRANGDRQFAAEALIEPTLPIAPTALHIAWLGEPERALRALSEHRAGLEASAAPSPLAFTLAQEGVVLQQLGRWSEALAAFERAASLADTGALGAVLAPIRVRHAHLLALLGRVEEMEAVLADPAVRRVAAMPLSRHTIESSRGIVALAAGDVAVAYARFTEAARLERVMGTAEPAFLPSVGDRFEAAWRLAREHEVADDLEAFAQRARRLDRTAQLAVALRCRALADGDDGAFAESERLHEASAHPFEHARTLLAWGRSLRRRRRRQDARDRLAEAAERFDALGARSWCDAVAQERVACGERPAGGAVAGPLASLTPRELEVVALVADGASNADVAARLVLSRRTAEYHLGNAYRKLGVSSRAGLFAALASAHADTTRPPGSSSGHEVPESARRSDIS